MDYEQLLTGGEDAAGERLRDIDLPSMYLHLEHTSLVVPHLLALSFTPSRSLHLQLNQSMVSLIRPLPPRVHQVARLEGQHDPGSLGVAAQPPGATPGGHPATQDSEGDEAGGVAGFSSGHNAEARDGQRGKTRDKQSQEGIGYPCWTFSLRSA